MNKAEALQTLQTQGFGVIDYSDATLVVHNTQRTQSTELSRNDLLDALDHEISMYQLHQIDLWTVVITF